MKLTTIALVISVAIGLVLVLSAFFNPFSTRYSAVSQPVPYCRHIESYHGLLNTQISDSTAQPLSIWIDRLLFLKTHKTASSTLSGILWNELCVRSGLNCFLPPYSNPGRTWDFESAKDLAYIHANRGTSRTGPPFDAWLHHAKMNDAIFTAMKPAPATEGIQLLSIVRDPAQRFRSAWSWYGLSGWFYPRTLEFSLFGKNVSIDLQWSGMSLESFTQLHPIECDTDTAHVLTQQNTITVRVHAVLHSLQAWYVQYVAKYWFKYRTGLEATSEELVGLRVQDPRFESRFGALLQRVLRGEVLLLVTDRFDESLLVLRRLLAYSPEYVPSHAAHAHTGTNKTTDIRNIYNTHITNITDAAALLHHIPLSQLLYLRQKKQSFPEPLSSEAARQLHLLQPHDSLLFRAASTMLDRHIARLYPNNSVFLAELSALQAQLQRVERLCSDQNVVHTPPALTEASSHHTTSTNPPHSKIAVPQTGEDRTYSAHSPRTTHTTHSMLITYNTDSDVAVCERLRRDNRDLVRLAWAQHAPPQ